MEGKIKILHYIPGFNYGGIEQRFISWYEKLDKKRFEFEVLVNTGSKSDLLDTVRDMGIIVHEISSITPLSLNKHRNFLKQLFETNTFKAVHCHSPDKSYYVLKYAKKYKIPVRILHARTSKLDRGKGYYLKKYYKNNSPRYANTKLAVSSLAGDWLFHGSKKDYKVLNNAIDLKKYKFNSNLRSEIRKKYELENNLVIGHVGRFTYAKNHKFLIDLFYKLNMKYPNTILLLIGDGPLLNNMKKYAEELNLTTKIIFIGYSAETEKYYPAMDLFLFPSIYEGLPGTLVEAQASGLNCIISNTISEEAIITDKVKVFNLNDSPEKWIESVEFTETDSREIKDFLFTEKGYNLDEVVTFLEKIYMKVND